MAYFSWSDDLRVRNSFIGGDHQKLIKLVNQFHEAMAQGHGKDILGKILDELIRYTRKHFKREEDHMQTIRYTDFQVHKQEHDKLIKDVVDLHQIQRRQWHAIGAGIQLPAQLAGQSHHAD